MATARLRQEVELQRQNPWFEPLGLAPYVPVARKVVVHGGAAAENEDARGNATVPAAPTTRVSNAATPTLIQPPPSLALQP